MRTGSIPSVAAGVTVGTLVRLPPLQPFLRKEKKTDKEQYGIGGYRISQKQAYGVELALLASVILAGSSIPRAIKTRKPLPIGLSLLATYGLINFGMAWQNKTVKTA